MLSAALRDMQWRSRRLVIAIVSTGLVFAMTLVLTGLANGFRVEAQRTVDSMGVILSQLLALLFPMTVVVPMHAYLALPAIAIAIGLLASVAGLRRAVAVDPALAIGGP
jgi:putative ABC transport system permease protein